MKAAAASLLPASAPLSLSPRERGSSIVKYGITPLRYSVPPFDTGRCMKVWAQVDFSALPSSDILSPFAGGAGGRMRIIVGQRLFVKLSLVRNCKSRTEAASQFTLAEATFETRGGPAW